MNTRRAPHARHTRRRAGFTLLEVVLAAVLGTLVMAGVLSIFFSLERTGGSLQVRGDQAAGLQRTRLVMQRAFNSILTAQVQVVRTSAGDRSEEETAPPRVLLEPDPNLVAMMQRPEPDGGGGGGVTVTPVQRLEIVLIDPPVPGSSRDPFELARAIEERTKPRREKREDGEANPNASATALAAPPSVDDSVRAVRGAFELRPQARRAGDPEGSPQAYELWWIPLKLEDANASTSARETEDTALTNAVERASREREYLISSDLTFVRWRMFDDRLKKTEFRAVAANKLPAYIEMQVRTRGGLEAEWLFEVGWAMGPETTQQQASLQGGAGGAGTSGLGTGRSTGTGSTTTQVTTNPVGTPIASPVPIQPAQPAPRPPSVLPSATPRIPPRTPEGNPNSVPNRVRRRTLSGNGGGN